jgi:hypothetical protein
VGAAAKSAARGASSILTPMSKMADLGAGAKAIRSVASAVTRIGKVSPEAASQLQSLSNVFESTEVHASKLGASLSKSIPKIKALVALNKELSKSTASRSSSASKGQPMAQMSEDLQKITDDATKSSAAFVGVGKAMDKVTDPVNELRNGIDGLSDRLKLFGKRGTDAANVLEDITDHKYRAKVAAKISERALKGTGLGFNYLGDRAKYAKAQLILFVGSEQALNRIFSQMKWAILGVTGAFAGLVTKGIKTFLTGNKRMEAETKKTKRAIKELAYTLGGALVGGTKNASDNMGKFRGILKDFTQYIKDNGEQIFNSFKMFASGMLTMSKGFIMAIGGIKLLITAIGDSITWLVDVASRGFMSVMANEMAKGAELVINIIDSLPESISEQFSEARDDWAIVLRGLQKYKKERETIDRHQEATFRPFADTEDFNKELQASINLISEAQEAIDGMTYTRITPMRNKEAEKAAAKAKKEEEKLRKKQLRFMEKWLGKYNSAVKKFRAKVSSLNKKPYKAAKGAIKAVGDFFDDRRKKKKKYYTSAFDAMIRKTHLLKSSLVGLGSTAAKAFGQLLTGATSAKGFGATILQALGDMALKMGQFLILAGAGWSAIPGFQASAGAVAAGVGLVALGGTLQGAASNITKGASPSGGGRASSGVTGAIPGGSGYLSDLNNGGPQGGGPRNTTIVLRVGREEFGRLTTDAVLDGWNSGQIPLLTGA